MCVTQASGHIAHASLFIRTFIKYAGYLSIHGRYKSVLTDMLNAVHRKCVIMAVN